MTEHTVSERFTLTLFVEGGRMPLTFFARTTEDLRKLLRAIEEAQLGEASQAHWEVDTDRIQIAASVNGVSAEDLESIINDAYQSLKATDAHDDASIPRTVNDKGRRLTRSIVNRVRRTQPVVVDAQGQEPVRIEAQQVDTPTRVPVLLVGRRRRQEVLTAWGSVDGELDVISVRRQAYFVIYEHGSTNQIRCLFPDDWMETVKMLLGHRVIAEGLIRYRPDGTITSLSEPTSIEAVPEPKRAVADFRGMLPAISGGLSSADYIRQMRTGDANG